MVHFDGLDIVIVDEITWAAGSWIDWDILGLRLRIPPVDVVVIPRIAVGFEWIFNAITGWLDHLAEEYYSEQK